MDFPPLFFAFNGTSSSCFLSLLVSFPFRDCYCFVDFVDYYDDISDEFGI